MNSRWPKVKLLSAATSLRLIYEITTATKAPGLALAILQYALLACALFAPIGSGRPA